MAKAEEITKEDHRHHNTGIMNKLRDKMPVVIIFLIVAFLITIIFEWGMNYVGLNGNQSNVFGEVNGEEIKYQEFEAVVQQQLEQMRAQNGNQDIDDATVQQIREQSWNQLVQRKLVDQEIARLGLTVTDQEVLERINRPETLPDVIRRNFIDSTGVFNMGFYQQALAMKTPEATNFWRQVEQFMRESILNEKLQSAITSGVIVTEGDVLQKYKDDNIKAKFEYILFDLNRATDSARIKPSEDELKKFYDTHKEDFKQQEAAKLKYVLFSDAPTMEDTNAAKRQLQVLIRDLKEANIADSSLYKLMSENASAYNDTVYTKPNALGPDVMNFLTKSEIGSVSEVIAAQDGFKIVKNMGSRDGADTFVRASHILINFGTDSAAALKKAEEVMAKVKNGGDFTQLAKENSTDPSAQQNGGDLGYFTKGAMVKEFETAALGGNVGDVIGPVKTQFGYHIIKVMDKTNKEFKVAEIKKTVTAGTRTKDNARKKAQDFYAQVDKGANIDTLAKSMNLTVSATPEVVKDGFIPGAGQNKNLDKFIFSNKAGKLSEPVKVTGGYAVYQIEQRIAEGYKVYDSVKTTLIMPRVIQEKKYEYMAGIARDMKSKIGTDINNIKNVTTEYSVMTADSVTGSAPNPAIGQDFALSNVIFNMKPGEISEPIKGVKGYYIVKMIDITPFDQVAYIAESETIRKQLLTSKQQQAVQTWLQNLQNKAEIVDNRDRFL